MLLTDPGGVGAAASAVSDRRVLLISPHNASLRPWYGVVWEFFDVVSRMEKATVIAPPARRRYGPGRNPLSDELTRIRAKAANAVRRTLGRPSTAITEKSRVAGDHDLCLFMCQFPHEIAEIRRVEGWRERSRFACAFVLETWPHQLGRFAADLRLLDRFDRVFTLNPASVAALARHTSAPVSFLPTAGDCLRIAGTEAERCIDILCIGRINEAAHAVITAHARERDLLYVHDVWSGMTVPDWNAARAMNAELVRRAKLFAVWDPAKLFAQSNPGMRGQSALSTRYFEGAAGGAAMVGSRPDLPEFAELFDWPDAVIDLPEAPDALADVLAALWEAPERLRAAGEANRRQALLRHDWAHRWAEILAAAGLGRSSAHEARLARLRAEADREASRRGAALPPQGLRAAL